MTASKAGKNFITFKNVTGTLHKDKIIANSFDMLVSCVQREGSIFQCWVNLFVWLYAVALYYVVGYPQTKGRKPLLDYKLGEFSLLSLALLPFLLPHSITFVLNSRVKSHQGEQVKHLLLYQQGSWMLWETRSVHQAWRNRWDRWERSLWIMQWSVVPLLLNEH